MHPANAYEGLEHAMADRQNQIRNPKSAIRNGFTMIELMVAIAITSILILFISQVFNTVQSTVSYGIRVADVLDHQRVISEQIMRDSADMMGPAQDGFIVIVNQAVPAYYNQEHERGSKEARITRPPYIRSDQLVFVRSRGSLEPICPDRITRFAGQSNAQFVRIWYGHGVRPRPDGLLSGAGPTITPPVTAGSRPASAALRYTVGDKLTEPGISSAIDGNLGGKDSGNGAPAIGTNQYASNWILGRQALFLDGTNTANQVIADNGFSNAVVAISGTPSGLPKQLWAGLSDVARISLPELHEAVLILTYRPEATNPNASAGSVNWEGALRVAFADRRLIVNPELRPIWQGNTADIAPWQVAQQHALLMPNVSEFAVDFAADIAGNWPPSRSATSTSAMGSNDIIDYVDEAKVQQFIKDPKIMYGIDKKTWQQQWLMDRGTETVNNDLSQRYRSSRIAWYSHYASTSPVTFGAVIDPSTDQRCHAPFGDVNGSGLTGRWGPYMDLRTSKSTTITPLKDKYPNASGMFVFHKNNPRSWPYMIRLRYRLHDSGGQLSDTTGEPGRSFEQIIRIRR